MRVCGRGALLRSARHVQASMSKQGMQPRNRGYSSGCQQATDHVPHRQAGRPLAELLSRFLDNLRCKKVRAFRKPVQNSFALAVELSSFHL